MEVPAPRAASAVNIALSRFAVHGQRQRHSDLLRPCYRRRHQAGAVERRDRQILRLARGRRRQGLLDQPGRNGFSPEGGGRMGRVGGQRPRRRSLRHARDRRREDLRANEERAVLLREISLRVKPIVVELGSNSAYHQFRVKMNKEKKSSMLWVMFAIGAALSWGVYGAMLHQGQVKLGSPLRSLLCVGVAYFLIGVIVPVAMLYSQGQLNGQGWNAFGATTATVAGALGAVGAVCIILAFKSGGLPTYVMPLVFGGAPVINVLVTMVNHPPKTTPNPLLFVGFLLVVLGASMVLYFRPQS